MKRHTPDIPDLDVLTATMALEHLRVGLYSAADLVAACQARIDRHNPRINALITLNRDQAQAAATEADRRMDEGRMAALLAGLPISIKDSFATHDLPTTASFAPLASYRPEADATVVARLRAAGAVIMGKSNLPELAGAPHCWSPLFGHTRNPWNPLLTPGGSSGGAAAAIAAGFSLLEVGSDIGGSIRIPAAYCGIAGLKATENRIPRSGHIPHLPAAVGSTGRSVWHMLSFGILARSVADLHLGYGLIAGPDGVDSTVPPFAPPAALPRVDARHAPRLRIALWEDFATPLCPATRRGLDTMVRKLEAAGHQRVRASPPDFDVRLAWETFGILAGTEIGLGLPAWQARLLNALRHLTPASQPITRGFMRGLALDLRAYNRALNMREELIRVLEDYLDHWDAVLCPVAPTVPYPARAMPAHRPMPRIDIGAQKRPYLEATLPMTLPFSVTGHPVVVLPVDIADGLPVGIQIIGKRWGEEALLARSAQLEAVFGGFTPPPGFATDA